MKKIFILLVLMLFLVTGCGSAETTKKDEVVKEREIEVVTISTEDVKEIVDNYVEYPDIDIVDVRTEEEYKEGHIAGSINIPLEYINDIHISTEREIIVYCNSGYQSHEAAVKLIELGYEKVKDMGSLSNWDYELEESEY